MPEDLTTLIPPPTNNPSETDWLKSSDARTMLHLPRHPAKPPHQRLLPYQKLAVPIHLHSGSKLGIFRGLTAGQCCQYMTFNMISKRMKTIIASIVGLVIMITVIFAQSVDKNKDTIADTIKYIKKETIGGKLDFTSILKETDGLLIDHDGVRFNKNDYYVFLWGQAVSDLGLESSESAAKLWEKIHDKKLTGPQRTALRIGLEKQLK